jgi:U3 small nucleolar RNA-associated protein 14
MCERVLDALTFLLIACFFACFLLLQTKNLLAQPLDQPIKQKLTREEAYEKKKEEITDKWETTVRENRKVCQSLAPSACAACQLIHSHVCPREHRPITSNSRLPSRRQRSSPQPSWP